MSRNDLCFCGSGKKIKKCHMDVKPESKLADMYTRYNQFDKKVDTDGLHAKCLGGCSACCNHFFFVSENEFLLILDTLKRKGGAEYISSFISAALQYHKNMELHHPHIMQVLTKRMPTMPFEKAEQYRNDNFPWDCSLSCIFLEDGRCSIYEARPSVCRTYGVCDECSLIHNEPLHFDKERELYAVNLFIGSISKRPYPLFYWFSHFLSERYYETALQKLFWIQNRSEGDYAAFTRRLKSAHKTS